MTPSELRHAAKILEAAAEGHKIMNQVNEIIDNLGLYSTSSMKYFHIAPEPPKPKLVPYSFETFPRSARWVDRNGKLNGIQNIQAKGFETDAGVYSYGDLLVWEVNKLLDHAGNELPRGVEVKL